MKVLAVNGSPRKKWNTARLLEKALEGASGAGAGTGLVHLYDLTYRGCSSCFACKRIGGPSYGSCAIRDDLTPWLDELAGADAIILGSPVYFFAETGEMRSCMERLCFPYLRYSNPPSSLFPRRIRTALVLTMNITEDGVSSLGLDRIIEISRGFMERVFGNCEILLSTDTLQFDDYSKYDNSRFDSEAKLRRRHEVFPHDEAQAFALGKRMASPL
ncbi:MAG: flavodoxin family protein [Planctomycetota bacterium]|nr:flavodoxin family protein [Planctomycetota bacterium]